MEGLLEAFITLFVIMNPIGNLSLFMSMTKGMPNSEIKRNIDRSVFVAGLLLYTFLFLGLRIFNFFKINSHSFEIAGGIILLIMGISYVFGLSLNHSKSRTADLSVPVGTPLLTGPGVIATTMILVSEQGTLITVVAAFLSLLATWLILMNSSRIYKILGDHWTNVISRVMGIILAAIAVKFITQGVLSVVAPLL